MGKMLTPDEILNKPGRLEPGELEIMRQHPVHGREILLASRDVLDTAIDVAHDHHERLDGSGYPDGIGGDKLSLYTRMVTIADVFDAITGDRVYRPGETAEKALGILHRGIGSAYDKDLVLKFTENIGTYPIGTIVEMHGGEVGIVVESNPDQRLRPRVKLLLNDSKLPIYLPYVVDLARPDLDETGKPYMIWRSHTSGSFGIDLSQHVNSYF